MKTNTILLICALTLALMAVPLHMSIVTGSPDYGSGGIWSNKSEAMHSCLVNCTWTDPNGLAGYIASTNTTGKWQNSTWFSMTGNSNVSTYVFWQNDTVGNVDSVKFYANNTQGNWNSTTTKNITVTALTDSHDWWDDGVNSNLYALEMWKEFWIAHGLSNDYWSVGKSYENNDILMFTCGNSSGIRALFDCQIHGWEDQGTRIMWELVNWLFSGDSTANLVLAKLDIMIIPSVDVDRQSRCNKDYSWPNGNDGVNINRNFATNFQVANPNSTYYSGPYALSEPETQTLCNVFGNYTPTFYMNLHSASPSAIRYYCDPNSANLFLKQRLTQMITTLALERGINDTMYQSSSYDISTGAFGYAVADAYTVYNIPCSAVVETDPDMGHNATALNDIMNTYLPNFKVIVEAEASINDPIFEAKTNNSGWYYIPETLVNCTTGASLKVQSTYEGDARADLSGGNSSGYIYAPYVPDGKVTLKDLVDLANSYGCSEGQYSGPGPRHHFNYMTDMNSPWKNDGLSDLVLLALKYEKVAYTYTYIFDTLYVTFDNGIMETWNNGDDLIPIPQGSTSFNVSDGNGPVTAWTFFYNYQPDLYTLHIQYNTTAINDEYAYNPPISNPSAPKTYYCIFGQNLTCTSKTNIAVLFGSQSIINIELVNPDVIWYDYELTGWTGTGSVPSSGSSNSTTFIIYENSTLTWNYRYTGDS